jgi:hypothetical protein
MRRVPGWWQPPGREDLVDPRLLGTLHLIDQRRERIAIALEKIAAASSEGAKEEDR